MDRTVMTSATPCPLRRKTAESTQSTMGTESFDGVWNKYPDMSDQTCNIDFTTAFHVPVLVKAQPKRAPRPRSTLHVYEDTEHTEKRPTLKRKKETKSIATRSERKSSLLAQPAQRFRPRVTFAPSPAAERSNQERGQAVREIGVTSNEENGATTCELSLPETQANTKRDGLRKDVRRNTVYIPPDDTTISSVFMGLFSPLKSSDPNVAAILPTEDTQIDSLEARIARRRQQRRSVARSPRRSALQPSLNPPQVSTMQTDIAGRNSGKENVPPGVFGAVHEKAGKGVALKSEALSHSKSANAGAGLSSRLGRSNSSNLLGRSTSNGQSVGVRKACPTSSDRRGPSADRSPLRGTRRTMEELVGGTKSKGLSGGCTAKSVPRERQKLGELHPCESRNASGSTVVGSVGSIPKQRGHKPLSKYPLLTEDISNPAVYEDRWLEHQEIVMTQLANELFDSVSGIHGSHDCDAMRYQLLSLYHDESFNVLHKRVQASLLYGTLSIPKDVLGRGSRLCQDMRLKQSFLNIWLDTYDLNVLRAAAEVVIGRKLPMETFDSAPDETNSKLEKRVRKELSTFLATFLLQNEDSDNQPGEAIRSSAGTCFTTYHRTVLRSIVLVVLLDKARCSLLTELPNRLLVPSSPYKSSTSVIQALGRLLLPSCGNITKALEQLGCHLAYEQHPLQDFEYRIDNLAVDLRDGVRLTRLVEILIQQSSDTSTSTATETLSGDTDVQDSRSNWPLSRHLKIPSTSRSAKIFNVQLALNALSDNNKGANPILENINAEDVVHGYREKTIALLWSIVSRWGIAELVDLDDVRGEIVRLERKLRTGEGHQQARFHDHLGANDNECQSQDDHAWFLERWASLLAYQKGIPMSNMSTSFADGKIYEAIVDEYEGYITGGASRHARHNHISQPNGNGSITQSLASRLRSLGCSSQFACLVAPKGESSGHILSREFTLASLAFLCSRLLTASRRARAATVLQRAWRRVLARRLVHRRVMAKSLAQQCAAVVQTRDRILWAKEVIVKWWRRRDRLRKRRGAVGRKPLLLHSKQRGRRFGTVR